MTPPRRWKRRRPSGELADAGELPIRVYLMWKGYGGADVGPMLAQDVLVDYRDRLTHRTLN